MISQLSANYQIGAIHTADTTWRLSTESEKVHRLYPPSIVQTQFGDKLNRCSRRFQVVSWPNLTLFQTQTIGKLKPWHRSTPTLSSRSLTKSCVEVALPACLNKSPDSWLLQSSILNHSITRQVLPVLFLSASLAFLIYPLVWDNPRFIFQYCAAFRSIGANATRNICLGRFERWKQISCFGY